MQKTLRIFSPVGPCLTLVAGAGPLVRETPKFWITAERAYDGSTVERRVSKANRRAHIEPCRSCEDHPQTSYPNGYMD